MKRKFNLYFFLLITILCLGLFLRIYRLSETPPGLFADEASIGYNAYSILVNGKDEYQKYFPVFFRSLDDYKGPVYIYSTVPAIYLFGLNEFATRLPAALYGIGTILFVYLLTKELLSANKHRKEIALFSSFLLAISPWHIHISRIAFEQSPFVFFTVAGIYFFIRSKCKTNLFLISVIPFALSFYSYSAAKIFIIFFFSLAIMIFFKNFLKNKKIIFLTILVSALSFLPFIYNLFNSPILARWQQVSIFSQQPQNKTVFSHIADNYLSHFSLDFLFLKGDIDMPGQFITRHSVRGIGELYLFQLPIIIFGFAYLFKKRSWIPLSIMGLWIILYPLGSTFTTAQSAQATRSIIGVIPFQIISAIGLFYILGFFTKIRKIFNYALALGISIIIFLSFTYYFNLYFIKYPLYSSDFWGWQYGPKETMKYFLSEKDKYDDLYMSGEFNAGHIFIPFYDPKNQCSGKCKMGDFYTQPEIFSPLKKQLFALSPEYLSKSNFSQNFTIEKTIYYPDGKIAFLIGKL